MEGARDGAPDGGTGRRSRLSYALATSCAARDGGLRSRETDKADSHRKGWTVTVDWGS